MKLSLQQKEQFFHELRELLQSGRSFGESLQVLESVRSRSARALATTMRGATGDGSAEAAFAAVPDAFSVLDREIVRGGEMSGEMAEAMGYLSEYYGTMNRARTRLLVFSIYPFALFHLGAVLLSIPELVAVGFAAFLESVAITLGIFYVGIGLACLLALFLVRSARVNPALDRALQSLPVIGKTRTALAGSRFCMMMSILVRSSGSILNAMSRAALASGSPVFQQGAEKAVVAVQGGEPLGSSVMRTRAFPEPIDRAFQLGEVSGRLDQEMHRQAERYTDIFRTRIDVIAGGVTKIFALAIFLMLGWKILSFYIGYYQTLNGLLE